MGKYYAVKRGRNTGIFTDWNACKSQVSGFPGAIYKSFKEHSMALEFLKFTPCVSKNISNPVIKIKHSKCIESLKESNSFDDTHVYTDGSCMNALGGYCFVTFKNGQTIANYGRVPGDKCTNNISELYAIYKCLLLKQGDIYFHTDSQYSMKCVTIWYKKWQRNGWKTSNCEIVQNKDLIESILELMKGRNIKFKHVYGHRGNKYNEIADKYAKIGTTLENDISKTI